MDTFTSSMLHTLSHPQHKQLSSSGAVSRAADIHRPNLSAAGGQGHHEDDTSTSASDNNFSYLLRPEDNTHTNGPESDPAAAPTPAQQPMTAPHKPLSRQTTLASATSTAVPTPRPTRRHPPRPPFPQRHQSAPSAPTTNSNNNGAIDTKETMIPADPFADSPTAAQPHLFDQLRDLMANVGNSELIAAKLAAVTAAAAPSDLPTPLSPPQTATDSHWHPHGPIPPPLRLTSHATLTTPPNTATSPRSWSARPIPPPKRQMSSTAAQQLKAATELQLPHHPPPPVPPSPAAAASASTVSRFRGDALVSPPPVTPARQISAGSHDDDAFKIMSAPAPGSQDQHAAHVVVSPVSLASSMSSSASSEVHPHVNAGKLPSPTVKEPKRTSSTSTATSASALREQQVKRYTSKLEKEKKNLLDHIQHASSTAHSLSTLLSQAHAHNDTLLRTLEDRELALHASERTLAKRDRDVSQLAAQLTAAQAKVGTLAERLDQTTKLLGEVQVAAQAQVQAVAEDREGQVARVREEMRDVGERWQERIREVEARLACKDAAVAVVQAQRREVVEMWGAVVKAVVGMVNVGGMGGVDVGQVEMGESEGGEEDLSSVLGAGTAVTEWLTRACDQVASAFRDVCGQLHAMTEVADASKARVSQLESQLADTSEQLAATRAELDVLQSADSELTGSLRTQLATVTADRDSLHADLTVIRHQLAATANERDHFSTDLARLQAELADAKSNQARMAGDLAMAKKLLEAERKYRRDHSAVQAELADVQSQLAQVQAERAADQMQLADEQSRRKAETGQLMTAVVEAQREVAQLREKLAMVQGGEGLLRSASRPASPAAMSVPTTPMSAHPQPPPPLSTASGKAGYVGGQGGFEGTNQHGGMTAPSPADSLSSTIARLQQRLHRSGNAELGSPATASPASARAAGI